MSVTRDDLISLASYGIPPNESVAEELSVALGGFISSWKKETLPFIQAGGAELRFLEAPYGRGKTHLLMVMGAEARKAGFATAFIQCSQGTKPFGSLADTYRSLASSIRFPTHTTGQSYNYLESIADLTPDQIQILSSSKKITPGLNNLIRSCWKNRMLSPQHYVHSSLIALLTADPYRQVSIRQLYRAGHGLQVPIGKLGKRTAMAWLRGILIYPQVVGLKGLVILFDETGADFHLDREPMGIKREHFANLRHIIDHMGVGNIPGCSITYAVAANFLESAFSILPPLAQRIERSIPNSRNFRTIWCDLDELTEPGIDTEAFFLELGQRIINLGTKLGYEQRHLDKAKEKLAKEALQYSRSTSNASVRTYIKSIASAITR